MSAFPQFALLVVLAVGKPNMQLTWPTHAQHTPPHITSPSSLKQYHMLNSDQDVSMSIEDIPWKLITRMFSGFSHFCFPDCTQNLPLAYHLRREKKESGMHN